MKHANADCGMVTKGSQRCGRRRLCFLLHFLNERIVYSHTQVPVIWILHEYETGLLQEGRRGQYREG